MGSHLTLTHELAHAFGLDHFTNKGENDAAYNITSYQSQREVQENDVKLIVEDAVIDSKNNSEKKLSYIAEVSSYATEPASEKTKTQLSKKTQNPKK